MNSVTVVKLMRVTDQDTVGPMARSVKDAAYLLQAIAGRDPKDNYTSAAPAKLPDYVEACDFDSLRGARVGVPRNVIERFSDNTTREPRFRIVRPLKAEIARSSQRCL